jgi:hypothetical protein
VRLEPLLARPVKGILNKNEVAEWEDERKGQGAKASNQKRQQAIDDATSNSTQPAKVGGVP